MLMLIVIVVRSGWDELVDVGTGESGRYLAYIEIWSEIDSAYKNLKIAYASTGICPCMISVRADIPKRNPDWRPHPRPHTSFLVQ